MARLKSIALLLSAVALLAMSACIQEASDEEIRIAAEELALSDDFRLLNPELYSPREEQVLNAVESLIADDAVALDNPGLAALVDEEINKAAEELALSGDFRLLNPELYSPREEQILNAVESLIANDAVALGNPGLSALVDEEINKAAEELALSGDFRLLNPDLYSVGEEAVDDLLRGLISEFPIKLGNAALAAIVDEEIIKAAEELARSTDFRVRNPELFENGSTYPDMPLVTLHSKSAEANTGQPVAVSFTVSNVASNTAMGIDVSIRAPAGLSLSGNSCTSSDQCEASHELGGGEGGFTLIEATADEPGTYALQAEVTWETPDGCTVSLAESLELSFSEAAN